MNEMSGVRKKLRRVLGQDVPDLILDDPDIRDWTRDYLRADSDEDLRDEAWGALEDAVRRALRFWNGGKKEGLSGVQNGTRGGSRDMRAAEERDVGKRAGSLDARELVGDRTRAMTGAMSALFALTGDEVSEVRAFREEVLPGRFLTADEAYDFIASPAARAFDRRWFKEWGIPFVGHRAEVLSTGPRGSGFDSGDYTMTIRVDPPGITKTVRYALPQESDSNGENGDSNTRCKARGAAIVPIYTYSPEYFRAFGIEFLGERDYPPWLWPGSVLDELYNLSLELAYSFDWPWRSGYNLPTARPWSSTGTLFILTGEAPQVRPMDANWVERAGRTRTGTQWRMQLTVPPWLPEEEVLRAVRALKRQRPSGRQMPKTAKPLEVARFVWERMRTDGYREPYPWTRWVEQWNGEHPGHRFKTASHFRTYAWRGYEAVVHLNYDGPYMESPFPNPDNTWRYR